MSELKPDIATIVKDLESLTCDVHGEKPKFILTESDLSIEDPCCEEFQEKIKDELTIKIKADVLAKTKSALLDSFREGLNR